MRKNRLTSLKIDTNITNILITQLRCKAIHKILQNLPVLFNITSEYVHYISGRQRKGIFNVKAEIEAICYIFIKCW
jgi:hypothetical protein